jgi:hypothetical protein
MYIIIYKRVNINIATYQQYISNLKFTIDNKKLQKQDIHYNYLVKKLFLNIFYLKLKGAYQTIAR